MFNNREDFLPPLNKQGANSCTICGAKHFREDLRREGVCGYCSDVIDQNIYDLEQQQKEREEKESNGS